MLGCCGGKRETVDKRNVSEVEEWEICRVEGYGSVWSAMNIRL